MPGYTPANAVNAAAFQNAFATLSTLVGVPLIGNPEAVAQRLEELTSIVGTLAEALARTAPAVNANTANSDLIAAHLVNLEAQIGQVETKVDWSEHQRSQGTNVGGQPWVPKAACESRAVQSIKNLGSDKTGFRLWNQKFVNAVTQIHTGARGFFEAIQVKLDTAKGAISDEEVFETKRRVEDPNNPIDIPRLNEDLFSS